MNLFANIHWGVPLSTTLMPERPFYKVFSRSRKHHFQPHSPYARRDSDVTGVETPLRCIKKTHRKRPPTAPDRPRSRVGWVGRPAASSLAKGCRWCSFFWTRNRSKARNAPQPLAMLASRVRKVISTAAHDYHDSENNKRCKHDQTCVESSANTVLFTVLPT